MTAEKPKINYYGEDVADMLAAAMKIVTLRQPNEKYDIEIGTKTTAVCRDSAQEVPVVVIDNTTKPLKYITESSLLLDGFPTAEVAASGLAFYYGEVSVDDSMQRIATIPEIMFESLSEDEQKLLLTQGLDAALRIPSFRKIFMPALFHWFGIIPGANINEWHAWLKNQGLVTEAEIEAKVNVDEVTKDYYRLAKLATKLFDQNGARTAVFRSVILHEIVSLDPEKK